jgi:hypothetical protein
VSGGIRRGPLALWRQANARPKWLPFWVLQAIEVAVAVIFVDVSAHVARGGLLVAAAIVFAGLALTAQGPLGLLRICGQRLHLVLITVTGAVVALAPVIPALRPDIEGIIVIEFGAIGLIRLATFTRSADAGRVVSERTGSPVIDVRATVVAPANPRGARARPTGPTSTGGAARWVGRTAAVVAESGKRVAAKHRPAAEARVKQSIRSAGRIAGRVTSSSPANPPPPPE